MAKTTKNQTMTQVAPTATPKVERTEVDNARNILMQTDLYRRTYQDGGDANRRQRPTTHLRSS